MSNQTTSTKTSDDLAAEALATVRTAVEQDNEAVASDKVAETLNYLQAVIERTADELTRAAREQKEVKEELANLLTNDSAVSEAEAQLKELTAKLKEQRSRVQNNPQALALRTKLAEMIEHRKETEEALSSHLLNYYQLTGSKSIDTSDGDQREFTITARMKFGR